MNHPSKLLVLDVEGTLFEAKIRLPSTKIDSTVWQAIAESLGPEAVKAEIETHRKWDAGEYRNYLEWMKDTIQIHKAHCLNAATFRKIIDSAEYNAGVVDTIQSVNRSKFEIVLVSGGFRELAMRAQRDLEILHAFTACDYFFNENGQLSGFNLLPCDFGGKIDFIKLMLNEYKLTDRDWCFIGDGSNDVEIARAAPMSIAFGKNQELKRASSCSISAFSELLPILNSLS